MGLAPPALSTEALAQLRSHAFPGNVRELKNVMERALILSGGKTIKAEHLQLIATCKHASAAKMPEVPFNLQEAEHVVIQRALESTGGNVAEAARLLGVNRSRIYRRFPDLAR